MGNKSLSELERILLKSAFNSDQKSILIYWESWVSFCQRSSYVVWQVFSHSGKMQFVGFRYGCTFFGFLFSSSSYVIFNWKKIFVDFSLPAEYVVSLQADSISHTVSLRITMSAHVAKRLCVLMSLDSWVSLFTWKRATLIITRERNIERNKERIKGHRFLPRCANERKEKHSQQICKRNSRFVNRQTLFLGKPNIQTLRDV